MVARDEVPPCCGRQASELGDGDGDAIGDGVGDGDGVGSAGGEMLGLGVAEDERPPGEAEPQAASKTINAARAVAFIVHVVVLGRPGSTLMRSRLKLAHLSATRVDGLCLPGTEARIRGSTHCPPPSPIVREGAATTRSLPRRLQVEVFLNRLANMRSGCRLR
jgi:hypothetical protein